MRPITPDLRADSGGENSTLPDWRTPMESVTMTLSAAVFGTLVTRPLPPFAVDSEFPAAPPIEIQNFAFKQPDGSEVLYSTTDPGLAIETGQMFDLEAFKTPGLRGLSKTAPYFHDNSAKTLRDVVFHYQGMFKAFARIDFPFGDISDAEIDPLAAYLGTL
jgi:hypothetical protein